eukprot:CAMPEP_0181359188 /NCGR_PEP_ID=MMETSP1106-20121128/5939_1 /TAXON_ID=81844 /ORGANISM="Mantoniella antarctica, Strain SL-175" /LENGTH=129 /DNA_ID=CAMNT_0023472257 /DNA_START=114 /DNA_END=500 /DNA_ORIENTATION=+
MSGGSAMGSADLGLLRQCEEVLNAIEAADDVESVVAAMRAHAGSARVQEVACGALRHLTGADAENRIRAGTVGAVEAVAAAMRAHAGNAGVQEAAGAALFSLRNMVTNAENRTRAVTAGAVEAVAAAMR